MKLQSAKPRVINQRNRPLSRTLQIGQPGRDAKPPPSHRVTAPGSSNECWALTSSRHGAILFDRGNHFPNGCHDNAGLIELHDVGAVGHDDWHAVSGECGKTLTASTPAGELGIPPFVVLLDGLITKCMGGNPNVIPIC